MTSRDEKSESEMAAQLAWEEPVKQGQSTDGAMPNSSSSTHQRPVHSNRPPTRPLPRTYATSSVASPSARGREERGGQRAETEDETDVVMRDHANASSADGGLISGVVRAFGFGQGYGIVGSADQAHLQKKVHKLERQLRDRNQEIAQLKREKTTFQSRLEDAGEVIQSRDHEAREAIRSLQAALDRSKARTSALQQQAAEHEEKLGKAYSAVVSNFAQDVSRDLPDDLIRNEISAFFQGDFFSWCSDLCALRIDDQGSVAEHLRNIGIINSGQEYLSSPQHLQFDMDLPDGSSPLVLLQAALAKALSDSFLTNPFFLAKQQQALKEFADELLEGDKTAGVDWRIQTVAYLESVAPFDHASSVTKAKEFETQYSFLLGELDEESREDLASLFTRFATLSLKLWKIRTEIAFFGMQGVDKKFRLGSEYMDAEQVTVSSLGQKLNDRPVGVVMRPLIIAEPVGVDSQTSHGQVVWSKALVWVSPRMPGDEMELGR